MSLYLPDGCTEAEIDRYFGGYDPAPDEEPDPPEIWELQPFDFLEIDGSDVHWDSLLAMELAA